MTSPNALYGPHWREDLISDRHRLFDREKRIDWAPDSGSCFRCGTDLVTFWGLSYPSVDVLSCPMCCCSYLD